MHVWRRHSSSLGACPHCLQAVRHYAGKDCQGSPGSVDHIETDDDNFLVYWLVENDAIQARWVVTGRFVTDEFEYGIRCQDLHAHLMHHTGLKDLNTSDEQ